MRERARTNTIMVFVKVAILVFFVLVGFASISGDNFSPWAPERRGRHRRRGGAWITTLMFGIATALIAALLPLTEIAKLVDIGTLFAFFIVNIGVIVLRRTQPDLERGFRVSFVPVFRSSARRCASTPDDAARGRDLVPARRVAGARADHLLRLRAHALAAAARRGRRRGARRGGRVGAAQ